MSSPGIYLDYNATTPVDKRVLEQMLPYFSHDFANAASVTHQPGRMVSAAVENARNELAELIGAGPEEMVFTSGATEAVNMALKGVANTYRNKGNHIITWASEHKAVLDTCERLKSWGFEISVLPVGRDGLPDLNIFEKTITGKTILVSMMLANNETGTIMPVEEVSKITHRFNSILLCDATQAVGKIKVDVNEQGVDMLALSAHKMYGAKGTGALYVRRKNPRVTLTPIIDGGGHERGLRSGTLNVPGIIGMGAAATLSREVYWEEAARQSKLRTLLEQLITTNCKAYVNGSMRNRLPNTTNIMFSGIKASSMLNLLPELHLATGSACTSAIPEPSHVLRAMGLSNEEAFSSIRFSLGRPTTEADITLSAQKVIDAFNKLRES